MSRYLKICLALCLLGWPVADSMAWRVRFDHGKNCPDLNRKVTWHDYITNKVRPVGSSMGNPYGVEFRWAKLIDDRDAIGNLMTNACYTGGYIIKPAAGSKKGYTSRRFYKNSRGRNETDARHGLPGDPSKYEINIHGVELMYTDTGFVLDKKGRRVGLLVCYGSNECGRY